MAIALVGVNPSVRTAQGWRLATLVLFCCLVSYADPYVPLGRDGKPLPECRVVWKEKGFTRNHADASKRSLFLPSRGESYFEQVDPEYQSFYQRLDRSSCFKKVTVLVYMAADNDLSRMSWRDIAEMEQVGSTLDVDVIVFQDDAQTDGMRYYHIAKRTNNFYREYKALVERYAQSQGKGDLQPTAMEQLYLGDKGLELPRSPLIKILPEGDSGDVGTAGKFLIYALSRYPSERVALIGWSHGEGFDADTRSGALDATEGDLLHRQGGFAFDYGSNSHMKVTEMVRGKTEGGLLGILAKYRAGHAIDWAGSDSCLNQQIEFGLEWEGAVDYLYGSAALLQGKGFNYGTLLRNLNSEQDFPAEEKALLERLRLEANKSETARQVYLRTHTRLFAKNIPAIYGRSVSSPSQDLRRSHYDPRATMAVWEMQRMGEVVDSLNTLARTLRYFVLHPKNAKQRTQRRFDLEGVFRNTRRFADVSNDLYHFLIELAEWQHDRREAFPKESYERQILQRLGDNIAAVKKALAAEGGAVLASYVGEYYRLK
ncbi:MAG: hypothetical protein KDD51_02810, partial [Bdellovibrionales bacterium]|nr:hypothetical protein [Bdellovibrionales bacterium]